MEKFNDNSIIQELIENIKNKKIIPFVGAGMSTKLGLPNWKDLVDSIVEKVAEVSNSTNSYVRKEIKEKRDLLETIEYLIIKANVSKEELLKEIINKPIKKEINSEDHENLATIGFPIIYTTNWDDIIEMTYNRLEIPYISIEDTNDFLKINNDYTLIFKFHGSLRYPNTLVLTESDYYERFGIDSPFDIRFRSDLLDKSMLFLGTSLRDYNIRYIWNRTQKNLLNKLGKKAPCSYYVSISKNEIKETVLDYNNIKSINLDSPKDFSSFLKYLADRVSK